jgi:ATP-dependent Lon protease
LPPSRAGIFEVILPRANEKDVAELPDNIKKSIKLHFVDQMDEVLVLALESPLPSAVPADAEVLPVVTQTEIPANLPSRQ